MEEGKESKGWMTVPTFGEWDMKNGVPDYSMDFTKIREMKKQNKSRASLGNEDELLHSNTTTNVSNNINNNNNNQNDMNIKKLSQGEPEDNHHHHHTSSPTSNRDPLDMNQSRRRGPPRQHSFCMGQPSVGGRGS